MRATIQGGASSNPVKLLDSETALAILGSSGCYPEIGDLRATVTGRTGVRALTVIKQDGATSIEGVRLDGSFEEDQRAVFPVFDESRPFARIYFRFIDKTWQIITLQDQ